MKNTFILLSVFLLALFPDILFSQDDGIIDSLEKRLTEKLPDTVRLDVLNDLARHLVDINPDKSINYAQQQLQLSRTLMDKRQQGFALLNIGNGNFNLANFKTALDSYIKALHLQESIGNKTGIASCSGSIGNVYLEMKQPDEAMKYFERTYSIFSELGKKRGAAAALVAIGTVYSDKDDYKKSLDYYFKSIKIFREVGDKNAEATVFNNIAEIYGELHEYKKSLDCAQQALALDQETGNIYNAALSLNNIGDLYMHMNNINKAIEFYKQALEKGLSISANDRILASYKNLSAAYKKTGDYKKALEMHELSMMINDTIYNSESSRQMAEMQARFNSEKKEKEIALLTKDKEIQNLEFLNTQSDLRKQRMLSYFVIAGLALMFLLAFFIYRGYLQKQKANKALEEKNSLIEEKSKEITDSILYAEKIQRAILPSVNELKHYFPESFVLFKPKDIVSGDFYWVAETDTLVFYATVDCTGHGVPGGFMSMLGTSLLNEIVIEKNITAPGEVLDMLRVKIIMALKQTGASGENKDGMDMVFCVINKKENVLEYAAAYNPVWIARNGKIIEYPYDKQPVGVSVTEVVHQFNQHKVALEKNDVIYTFTDGYADQFGGPKGKKFRYKHLQEKLLAINDKPLSEQKEILYESLENWKGNLDQVDDILIIGVRI